MRYYIVDDNEEIRILLKLMLRQSYPALELAGESDSAETALGEIPRLGPEMVLVDLGLPDINGIDVIRRLKPVCKKTRFLVITAFDTGDFESTARAAGADAILSKTEPAVLIRQIGRYMGKEASGLRLQASG